MNSSSSSYQRKRIVSTGERPMMSDNSAVQPLSPKDERTGSAAPCAEAANIGAAHQLSGIPNPHAYFNLINNPNIHFPCEWDITHPGYGQSFSSWNGYLPYPAPEAVHMQPVSYHENPSLVFHPGYSFNPFPPLSLEGQLLCPQQLPFPQAYFPHLAASSSLHYTPESGGNSALLDPVSGYVIPLGQFGGDNLSRNQGNNALPSLAPYPRTMGILGPYEQNALQLPLHGRGIASSSSVGGYPHMGSYHSPVFAASYYGVDHTGNKAKTRERDQSSVSTTNDPYGNRGPRASKLKSKSSHKPSFAASDSKSDSTSHGPNLRLFNRPDFVTDYKNAKFFIIKSFSEDNAHRSIKYNIWSSTSHGNKKLDTAYGEAQKMGEECPLFLFFSVNASGQFCGVSEMVGPVDFDKDAAYWKQDRWRWSGQFPVKWHLVKDVPNHIFCHILLENNDNKPVTHSRDSQEVKLEQGIEMLRIFKEYEAHTSILDDFAYYDEREKPTEEERGVGENEDRRQKGGEEESSEKITGAFEALTLGDADAEETELRMEKGMDYLS